MLSQTRGAIFSTLAFFCGSVLAVSVKLLDNSLPLIQLLFFRFSFGFAMMMPFVGLISSLWPKNRHWHLLRASLALTAIGCFFYAVQHMDLSDYAVLHHFYPLVCAVLAFVFLNEHFGRQHGLALILGLSGVLIIAAPQWTSAPVPVSLVLVGVTLGAVSDILTKFLTKTDSTYQIIFLYFLQCTIITGLIAPWVWIWPSTTQWLCIISIGMSGLGVQYFLARALLHLEANRVSIFRYSELVWSLIFGMVIWQEPLTLTLILGCVLIVSSGMIIHRIRT